LLKLNEAYVDRLTQIPVEKKSTVEGISSWFKKSETSEEKIQKLFKAVEKNGDGPSSISSPLEPHFGFLENLGNFFDFLLSIFA